MPEWHFYLPPKENELFFVLKVYVHNGHLACPIWASVISWCSKMHARIWLLLALGNRASAYGSTLIMILIVLTVTSLTLQKLCKGTNTCTIFSNLNIYIHTSYSISGTHNNTSFLFLDSKDNWHVHFQSFQCKCWRAYILSNSQMKVLALFVHIIEIQYFTENLHIISWWLPFVFRSLSFTSLLYSPLSLFLFLSYFTW